MQLQLPAAGIHTKIDVQGDRPMDEDEFFKFCMENSDLRIEREANGEIIVMPPAGYESDHRNLEICRQLGNWAMTDERGVASGPSTEFVLANGAARGPDAAWTSKIKLKEFDKQAKKRFLNLCPDFVVELISPSDSLKRAQAKMAEWIANGALLGWLIDADRRTIYFYRPGRDPEILTDIGHIEGEGPVEGFRLELAAIWAGL